MLNYKFVIVSKDANFKMPIDAFNDNNIVAYYISNNVQPITQLYNSYLKQFREEKDADIVVFMHADVQIDLKHLIAHIEECKDKYDILGLCGTSIMNVSQSPLNWWTGSNPTPTAKWGCVTHGELGNVKSFFSQDRANILDHEVACIDGLCIILTKTALNTDIKFDETFLFDLYDTDLSFQAILKYRLRLGVLVEESLQHFSVGKSILNDDFLIHELDFRKKWNLELPANSRIMQLSIEKRKQENSN